MRLLLYRTKTAFCTIAVVLVLFSALAILDKNNDFSLAQRESAHKFGATYMTMNNPFFEVINETIRATVESNGDILITRDPALDAVRQTQQIYDLIDEGVEAIFIAPVDFEKIIPAIKYGRERGIKIIFVDTEIYDESLADCTVVSDNYHAGVLCAEYLLQKKAEGKILIFEHPTTKSSNDRVEGFADTIGRNGDFEIVDRLAYSGQLEIAMPLMIEELKKGTEFDVVFSINDVGALGVMAALKDYGKLDGISVLGVDGAPEAKSMIKEKIMLATSAQYPSEIGQNAVDQLYNMIEGRYVQKKIKVSVNLISEENIDEFSTKGWQ
ncbi:MAG: sugar ABC transporter substrate-binding protein [Lachnospiraceae bacterium]|nr:sugar ABC transporter substrate-binding protein [Lachnospiraceae bacterium]